MRVSVVIPVHNEAENIQLLLREVESALAPEVDFEIIVVDDGSTDDTDRILNELKQTISTLRVIRHRSCCGQSAALITGIRAATSPLVATLDGDGQNDPSDLPRMIELICSTVPGSTLRMVAGFRSKRRDSLWRVFCSRVANGVRSRILQDATADTGCGIKVFLRVAFLRMPHFNHMHRFFPSLIIRDGGTVISVPVNHRPRVYGRSHYGTFKRLIHGVIDLMGVAWLMRRNQLPVVDHLDAAHDERTDLDNLRFDGTIPLHRPVRRAVA